MKKKCFEKQSTPRLVEGGVASDIYVANYVCPLDSVTQSKAKQLVVKQIADQEFEELILRGFELHKNLPDHPNIIEFCGWFKEGYGLYNIIEYFDGKPIDKIGKIDQTRLCSIVKQVLSALLLLGSKGIIHRDVKPENILINDEGLVKLIDFDTAMSVGDSDAFMMGSGGFIAPESFRDNFTLAADMYSLGVTIYTITAGKRYNTWSKLDDMEGIDEEFKALAGEMLERDPEKRITAEDAMNQVEKICATHT